MTVRELIEKLSTVDQDRIVVMASDAEGNSYSPLADLWAGSYLAESTWSGSVGLESLTDADRERGYTDEDVVSGSPAIILSPTN